MPPRQRRATTSNNEKEERQGAAPDPTKALAAAIAIFDEEFQNLNLHGKIATITGYIGRVPKNGHNKFNNYDYVLESDLVEAVRYYLAAARILVYVSEIREHEVFTFEGQTTGERSRARDILTDNIYLYRVVDGRTGEAFTFEVNGQGSDPRDKGSNKASTGAMKFAYLRLFNIASGEDEPEGDAKGDQEAAMGTTGTAPSVTVTSSNVEGAQRGGKQEKASLTQIRMISSLSDKLSLGPAGLAAVIKRVLGDDIELPEDEKAAGGILARYLASQVNEDVGKIAYTLQQSVDAAETPGDGYGS